LVKYKCYFDGSYTPLISGYAFCVIVGDKIVHSDIKCGRLQTSHHAETEALIMLLKYIQDYIEPGSTVKVYGDDKSLISKILYLTGQKYVSLEVRLLYEALKENYAISLTHISGKENKIAHNLSRIIYNTRSSLMQTNSILEKEGLSVERRCISLDDIFIPDYFKNCILPGPGNYKKRLNHCQKYGRDHNSRIISVSSGGQMISGYTTYLILRDSGITSCDVNVWTDKTDLMAA